MPVELSRRGFLGALLGTVVVAVIPKPLQAIVEVAEIDPFDIVAPNGTTYQWITSHVMGHPCPENIEGFLARQWTFVDPRAHPGAPTSTLHRAIDAGGLLLVQLPTVIVEQRRIEGMREAMRGFPAMLCPMCKGRGVIPPCPVCGPAAVRGRARHVEVYHAHASLPTKSTL